MSPDIITFEKSLEKRYEEYMSILGARGPLPASEIKSEWIYIIESVIEAGGWQAVWKISRQQCQDLGIDFPTVVLVMVKCVLAQDLAAEVNIVAVQDDISLPEEHLVPLINLYPIKQQEFDVLNVAVTADCLDQFRFFYNHLWRPWDCDNENQDWLSAHLEPRLKLFYDMQSGEILHETGQHIRSLLQEGRDIEMTIQAIKDQNAENDEIIDEVSVGTMMDLQIRRDHIKEELEILENPELRHIMEKKKQKSVQMRRQSKAQSQEACFVWLGGSVEEFIEVLTCVKAFIHPETFLRTSSQLQEALDHCVAGDEIILCHGVHGVCSSGGLEEGGSMKGFKESSETIISSQDKRNVLLDLSGDVTIENLTINAQLARIALSVRHGTLKLSNCRIVGSNASNTGIIVLNGANFEANNCEFVNFGTGIVLDSGANGCLLNSTIMSCSTAIKMCEDASLNVQNSKIINCLEYGLRIETEEKKLTTKKIESVKVVESFENIQIKNTMIEGSKKGEVLLIPKQNDILYESEDSGCFSLNSDNKNESFQSVL